MSTTATFPSFSLQQSAAAADFYREYGFAVCKHVFSSEEIARVHAATNRLKAGIEAGTLQSRGSINCIRHHTSGKARANYWGSIIEPELDALRTDQRMLQIIKPLLGDSIRQLTNHLHWKPPGTTVSVNFHTDRVNRKPDGHFRDLGNAFVQTAIAIDPMTPDNGPLLVVPGSHKSAKEMREDEGNYGDGHPDRSILAQKGFTEEDLYPVIAEAGDVVLWHPDTIHGSDQNNSDIDRCIYINGYIKASCTWRGHWAFIKGQGIPIPPIDVPVAVFPNACDERWQERFPLD